MIHRNVIVLPLVIVLAGCSSPDTAANNRDTMTQRQKDSVLAQSGLPGAQGVGKALIASDSQKARQARLDSASLIRKGGASGPAISPAEISCVRQSFLWRRYSHFASHGRRRSSRAGRDSSKMMSAAP